MVSYSCNRFFRSLRSMCAPIAAIVGFSCLLTFIFILYQPTPGPGTIQKLGWQSWDIVSDSMSTTSSTSSGSSDLETGGGSSSNQESTLPEGVDWWNVTNTDKDVIDFGGLPLDEWTPLLPHDTGLSEIAVSHCLIEPAYAPKDMCNPSSTKEDDAIKGKWVRIPRNLNAEAGQLAGYLNVFYRRTRRQDVPLVTDIRLLPEKMEPSPLDGWSKAATSLRYGYRAPALYLWYRTGKTAGEMTAEEKSRMITEIDLLYGDDEPWYGFEKLEPPTLPGSVGKWESTRLAIRRGVKLPPRAPPLHFSHDGKFKIMQIADLHYSVSIGVCRDVRFDSCEGGSDNLTNTLLGKMLDIEKPDLVVFTGDQLNGQETSWDPKSVLAKFAKAVTDRKIPWAAVFGNHDSEVGGPREEQVKMMQALPYSLVERGPKDVYGVGNYVLKVLSADASMTHLLTLYFMDSNSYRGQFDFWGFFHPTQYDWIHQDQIDWFLQESSRIEPIERPFRPDGAKDLGKIWNRQDQLTPTTRKLAKPNALMFFHIPLQEAYAEADRDPQTNRPLDVGMRGNEKPGSAEKSEGFFEKGLLAAMESDRVGPNAVHEVKVIANGHCHITDNCRRVSGIWMCFGGGGSYSGYGKVGFDRRFRIYDISDYGETITTYKRLESESKIHELVIAGKGAAPLS